MTRPTFVVLATRPVGMRSSSRAMGGASLPLDWPAVMAASKRPSLAVEKRPERGSRAARRLRREGFVPGVVYGGGDGEGTAFKVGWRDPRTPPVARTPLPRLKIDGRRGAPPVRQ